jgi:hypothetical protein
VRLFHPCSLSTGVDRLHRGPSPSEARNLGPFPIPIHSCSRRRGVIPITHITIRVVAERESQVEEEMSSFSVERGREKKTETACPNRNAARGSSLPVRREGARVSSLSRPLAWSIRHVPNRTGRTETDTENITSGGADGFGSRPRRNVLPLHFLPPGTNLGSVVVAIGNSDRSIDREFDASRREKALSTVQERTVWEFGRASGFSWMVACHIGISSSCSRDARVVPCSSRGFIPGRHAPQQQARLPPGAPIPTG